MSQPIEKVHDVEIESPIDTLLRHKIDELVDRTNENTRLIEAMPDYPQVAK